MTFHSENLLGIALKKLKLTQKQTTQEQSSVKAKPKRNYRITTKNTRNAKPK